MSSLCQSLEFAIRGHLYSQKSCFNAKHLPDNLGELGLSAFYMAVGRDCFVLRYNFLVCLQCSFQKNSLIVGNLHHFLLSLFPTVNWTFGGKRSSDVSWRANTNLHPWVREVREKCSWQSRMFHLHFHYNHAILAGKQSFMF